VAEIAFVGVLLFRLIGCGVFAVAMSSALMGMVIFARLAAQDRRAPAPSEAEMIEDRLGAGDRIGESADFVGS
jgi:hypothetical protein